MQNPQITEFGEILLYIIGGLLFLAGGLITAWIIRPNRPNQEKLTTYECGEDPSGTAWGQFNIRFYITALIFVLFDVEIIFLFPWATVFGQKSLIEGTQGIWGWFSLAEMFIFMGILAIGLAYAWAKGFLNWEKPVINPPIFQNKIPTQLYENINKKEYLVKSQD